MNQHDSISLPALIRRREEALGRGEAPSSAELCRGQPEMVAALEREIGSLEMHRLGICPAEGAGTGGDPFIPRPGAEPVRGHRLVARIGGGGSGEVWRAIGPGGFPVALKFVRIAEGSGHLEARAPESIRKARECNFRSLELVREIRHPNLLTMFGAWERDGLLIIGMELADRTLMDRCVEAIDAGLPGIPMPELLGYMRQAARGIDHLNTPGLLAGDREVAGIQHRDVKPQNLLLIGDVVKLGDFGLASLRDESIGQDGMLTPSYAAPELCKGRVSGRSDQYSLAVTYCHLRGGGLPFGGSPCEVMIGHCMGEPDLTMLPGSERPAVLRALAKGPAGRWPDCRSFVEALAAAGGGGPASPPGRPRAILRPVVLAGLLAVASAPLIAVSFRGPEFAGRRISARPALPDSADVTAGIPPRAPHRASTDAAIPGLDRSDIPVAKPNATEAPPPVASAPPSTAPTASSEDGEPEGATAPIVTGDPAPPPPPGPAIAGKPIDGVSTTPDDARPLVVELPSADAGQSNPVGPIRPEQPPDIQAPEPPPLRTATVHVVMPAAKAELAVRGAVGKGQPDEWYGPRRVIHTPPMAEGADYLVGAFWLDPSGRPQARNCRLRVEPGMSYEVDLRPSMPTSRPIEVEARPSSPDRGNTHEGPRRRLDLDVGPPARK